MTAGLKHYLPKEIESGVLYQGADVFFLNPQVAFAANDRVSIIGGVNLKFLGKERYNRAVTSQKYNSMDYQFGINYGLKDNENIGLIATLYQDFNVSNDIRLSYSKKF